MKSKSGKRFKNNGFAPGAALPDGAVFLFMKALAKAILQNTGMNTLVPSLDGGAWPALVTGAGAMHRAQLAAALRLETGAPLFVVAPDETAAETLAADFFAFTGERAQVLSSRGFVLCPAETVSRQDEHKRLAVLDALACGDAPVCICTAAALLQRTIPPAQLKDAAFSVSMTDTISPDGLVGRLLRLGYTMSAQVEGPGQMARRGGIVDVFSPAQAEPVRIEFWGDDVDSISLFDPESQRRTQTLSACRILPATETPPLLAPGGAEGLAGALEALAKRLARRKNSERAVQLAREDAERLRGGVQPASADRCFSLIFPEFASAADYIPPDALVLLDQPARINEQADRFLALLRDDLKTLAEDGTLFAAPSDFARTREQARALLAPHPIVMAESFTRGRHPFTPRTVVSLTAKQLPARTGGAAAAAEEVQRYLKDGFGVLLLAADERRASLLCDMLAGHGVSAAASGGVLPQPGQCLTAAGLLSAGLEYPELHLAVLTDTRAAGALQQQLPRRKKAMAGRVRIASCADLTPGDLVVHEQHGIGRFDGVTRLKVEGGEKDYIKISYAGTDVLYVPASSLDLVTKYTGAGENAAPRLSKIGGTDWGRTKSRARASAKAMAAELVQLYARRQRAKGHAFAPDSPWQHEFEDAFPYAETEDQLRCIAEIKHDMEREVPMERLLCGDVGYGKTEVALRAIMKCILDGMQAAILVPTTVLAQQHYQTVLQRFQGFPVEVESLSRFRTSNEQKRTLEGLKSGRVDLVVGTHRLLSKDVSFKRLGLLVVDEEQRFGVAHKEHIKRISEGVDVLTLSATPIPRTLNMALSGIRDMSVIEEPPSLRQPVQTFVMEHDWKTVCDAIRRELARGGQVYYLHNRVDNIERTALRLREMLGGEVRVAAAHGKMDEQQLSAVMERMADGEVDVLVCTTIIETGVDIPNVNTLIIEDADRLGLAQLHQIRGRVGRSSRQASAYLTFRRDKQLSEIAEKRLEAIREFAGFNSGFGIAMRDLEIRGAGSLLGAEQSGRMSDVGYDMYLRLLEEAVLEERGEKPPVRAECSADLAVSAGIPERYVPFEGQRMDLYRRIALIRTEADADDLIDELCDRFGDPPHAVISLVEVALLRGEASRAGIRDISQKGGRILFTLAEFSVERLTALDARKEYRGRVRAEPGEKPVVSLRPAGKRTLDEARAFVRAWGGVPADAAMQTN